MHLPAQRLGDGGVMSDTIQERLRRFAEYDSEDNHTDPREHICTEAADEIDRLSARIEELEAEVVRVKEQRNDLRVRLQCLAGDLERATLSALRTVGRKWEASDE